MWPVLLTVLTVLTMLTLPPMPPMTKNEIADILVRIATLLELTGENPFKVRAYQAGARALEAIEESELDALVADEAAGLKAVKGIGDALAEKIATLRTTGALPFYEKLQTSIAPGLVAMLEVPGLGPKKIKALHDRLGIDSLEKLAAACAGGTVARLPGFGEKSQRKIVEGIRNREAYGRRHLWWDADAVAQPVLAGLRRLPAVSRAEAAGSLRRGLETVGGLDFIVALRAGGGEGEGEGDDRGPGPVVDWFCGQPDVREVTARGDTKASVRFGSGLQADLRLVPEAQYAFALHHFTGSKDHNVQMRQRALARGLSLSEWGLTPTAEGEEEGGAGGAGGASPAAPADTQGAQAAKAVQTETDLFARLGLHYIPPELREGLGEIGQAEKGDLPPLPPLPRLVEAGDLRGAFHNHTTASDGGNTLAEMVAAAEALGWDYLGIADHSKASVQARGLDEKRLAAQLAEIRALNASGRFRTQVLAGVECDILADGRLDYDDAALEALAAQGLEYLVASVHNAFSQTEAVMTERILRAIAHPRVTMLGHATGRLLLQREGYRVDPGKVIDAAIAHRVIIELNANPMRLDLDWRHWRRVAGRGLFCAINPDAHDTAGLSYVRAGINAARKGVLTSEQVLNTRPLDGVRRWFRERR
ncbi:MAG: PHP domain-containing protein [Opitutaceae bacterium]|nr:PHP domain-containing protein [Opitutaceae bacterium]